MKLHDHPFLPRREPRNAMINLRVTRSERELLRRASKAANQSISDWIRSVLHLKLKGGI